MEESHPRHLRISIINYISSILSASFFDALGLYFLFSISDWIAETALAFPTKQVLQNLGTTTSDFFLRPGSPKIKLCPLAGSGILYMDHLKDHSLFDLGLPGFINLHIIYIYICIFIYIYIYIYISIISWNTWETGKKHSPGNEKKV